MGPPGGTSAEDHADGEIDGQSGRRGHGGRQRAHDDLDTRRGLAEPFSGQVTKPPLHPISADGRSDRLGDHETDPSGTRLGAASRRGSPGSDERRGRRAAPCAGSHPPCASETAPATRIRRPAQADSLARPLRRRAARMARPARVRIRSRKPWVRLRRRLLGWKVRLLTGGLPHSEDDCSKMTVATTPTGNGGVGRIAGSQRRPPNGTGTDQVGQTRRRARRSRTARNSRTRRAVVEATRRIWSGILLGSGCRRPAGLLASRLFSTFRFQLPFRLSPTSPVMPETHPIGEGDPGLAAVLHTGCG